jgi:DNA-binding transcriptional ArsR family regulator
LEETMPETHDFLHDSYGLPEEMLEEVVATFKALSDPTRAQILYILTQQEVSVNELTEHVPVSASAVSHHLAKLRALGLVQDSRQGNQVFYSIDDSHVASLFREALSHLDHVRQNMPELPYQTYVEYLKE